MFTHISTQVEHLHKQMALVDLRDSKVVRHRVIKDIPGIETHQELCEGILSVTMDDDPYREDWGH